MAWATCTPRICTRGLCPHALLPAPPAPPPQELEEMRHECTVLLRERFQLEQCVRCAKGGREREALRGRGCAARGRST